MTARQSHHLPRPLLVTDCDEVLLHMVAPFRDWLAEAHDIVFELVGGDFGRALKHRDSGALVEAGHVWTLLNGFFDTEMDRQTPFAGAVEALTALAGHADIVVLTNLLDHRRDSRARQLARVGLDLPVVCNQGGKGEPLARIVAEYAPSMVLFIDDLPQHHQSAAEHVPDSWRLHMVGEAELAPHITCAHRAGYAHARIDRWDAALPWLLERIAAGEPAPATIGVAA